MTTVENIHIPCSAPINGEIRVPGSKSITNRAILIAALAQGKTTLSGVLHSDDTYFMKEAWTNLGVNIEVIDGEWIVHGCGGSINPYREEIYVENAGTAARFLTAALTLEKGTYTLTGNERMQKRPIKDLVHALNHLGATVKDIEGTDCPPVAIKAEGLGGGRVVIPGDKSSQYISAIMLAAPYAQNKTQIEIDGHLVSKSYVEMTRSIMAEFGVHADWRNDQTILIENNQAYSARKYAIEADASSASYFFAMAAITKGIVAVKGIKENSTQGDIGLVDIFEKMGCRVERTAGTITLTGGELKGIDVDMNTMSDVAPTLAVVAMFAKGETMIRNVGNMRIKECDRISAVTAELRKLGVIVEEYADGLKILGGCEFRAASLDTYDDHRMAMSLSLAGLAIPGVVINDPKCVSKTFPDYFEEFMSLIRKRES